MTRGYLQVSYPPVTYDLVREVSIASFRPAGMASPREGSQAADCPGYHSPGRVAGPARAARLGYW
jgi:hypothetical protein